jgi:hypothetical protein
VGAVPPNRSHLLSGQVDDDQSIRDALTGRLALEDFPDSIVLRAPPGAFVFAARENPRKLAHQLDTQPPCSDMSRIAWMVD